MTLVASGSGSDLPGAHDDVAGSVPRPWPARANLVRLAGARVALWPKSQNASAMVVLNKQYRFGATAVLVVLAVVALLLTARNLIPGVDTDDLIPVPLALTVAAAALVFLLLVRALTGEMISRRISERDHAVLIDVSAALGTPRTEYQWNLNPTHGTMVCRLLRDMIEYDERAQHQVEAYEQRRRSPRVEASWSQLISAAGLAESG